MTKIIFFNLQVDGPPIEHGITESDISAEAVVENLADSGIGPRNGGRGYMRISENLIYVFMGSEAFDKVPSPIDDALQTIEGTE